MGKVKATRAVSNHQIKKGPPFKRSIKKEEHEMSSSTETLLTTPSGDIHPVEGTSPSVLSSILRRDMKISKQPRRRCNKGKSVSFSKNLLLPSVTELKKTCQNFSYYAKNDKASADVFVEVLREIENSDAVKLQKTNNVAAKNPPDCQPSTNNSVNASTSGQGQTTLKKIVKNKIKTKKNRRRIRKEVFNKKLAMLKATKDEKIATEKRKKTVIVGDLKPITKVLEDIEIVELVTPSKFVTTANRPAKEKFTMKKRQKELLEGLKYFETAGL